MIMRIGIESEEILCRFTYGFCLLVAHRERAVSTQDRIHTASNSIDGSLYVTDFTLEPFTFDFALMAILQHLMHSMVIKGRTIIPHSRTNQLHFP